MSSEGSYNLEEFAQFLDQTLQGSAPAKDFSADIERLRELSEFYKNQHLFELTKSKAKKHQAASTVDFIRSLAKEYKKAHETIEEQQRLSIKTAADVQVALFRIHKSKIKKEIAGKTVSFDAPELPNIPRLPDGYGFKGGAARLALASLLGKNVKNRMPRDFDIFRIGTAPDSRDRALAAKYMPEDLKHGHGIELVPDLDAYFATRDLTINQIAYCNGAVVCTFSAMEDFLNGVLMPTSHVTDAEGYPQGKITMKMVRMVAEGTLEGTQLSIGCTPFNPKVTPFDIALHLQRALSRGTRAAQYYVQECIRLGFLCETDPRTELGDVIEYVKKKGKMQGAPPKKSKAAPGLLKRIGPKSKKGR